jgi:hypothetical protein
MGRLGLLTKFLTRIPGCLPTESKLVGSRNKDFSARSGVEQCRAFNPRHNRHQGSSAPSNSQHLNSVGGDHADMSSPFSVHRGERTHERLEILRGCWINAKQNNAGLFQRRVALNCNLPEVLVQRKHDPRFNFREIQQGRVLPSG